MSLSMPILGLLRSEVVGCADEVTLDPLLPIIF